MHNKLKVRRAELELSQFGVAGRIAGMGRDRFLRIELGYTEPTEDEIAELTRALALPNESPEQTREALFPTLAQQAEQVQ